MLLHAQEIVTGSGASDGACVSSPTDPTNGPRAPENRYVVHVRRQSNSCIILSCTAQSVAWTMPGIVKRR